MSIVADPTRANHSTEPEAAAASAPLSARLQEALRCEHRMLRRSRWMQSGWWWLGALLAVVVSDALWQWHELGRLLGAAFLLLFALVLLVRVFFTKTSHASPAAQQLHAAAALEKHHGLTGQPLINALWLAEQNQHTSPSSLTYQLQQRSLRNAAEIASQTDIPGSIDRRRYRFHRTRFIAVLAVCLLLGVLMPRLTATGLQRLLNPWGNHPPFSLTRFHISLPDGPIEQGSDVTVDITLTGQQPATLDWVALKLPAGDAGFAPWRSTFTESQRWRLEPLSQGKYRHRLRHLNEAVTFELQTETGQSQRVTIRVEPRAVAASQPAPEAQTASPTPATQPAATPPATQAASNENQIATSDNPDVQAAAAAMQSMGTEAGRLASASENIKQQLQSAPTGSTLLPEQMQGVDDIAAELEAFKRMAADFQTDLKAQHAAAADQQGDAAEIASDQSLMLQMAQTLASLLTPKQEGPAAVKSNTADAMAQCMSDLAAAARSDQQKLSQPSVASGKTAGESENPSGETAAGNNAAAADPSGDSQQLRQGAYHQTGDRPASGTSVQTQARSRGVPEMYRPQVERYFDRLNEEKPLQPLPDTTQPVHDGAIP